MTDSKKTPELSEEDAFYWSERNVLKEMTPEQTAAAEKKFALSAKALADHLAGKAVKTQHDFDRKVATATDVEFAKIKADLLWEAQKRGQT